MKKHPMGAALAGIGLLLVNGAVVPDAASAAALTSTTADTAPQMLDPVSIGANVHLAHFNGQIATVSSEQIDAFASLSPSIQAKLGAADKSPVFSAAELVAAADRNGDTRMCPWKF